jgi:hypothetical protein
MHKASVHGANAVYSAVQPSARWRSTINSIEGTFMGCIAHPTCTHVIYGPAGPMGALAA